MRIEEQKVVANAAQDLIASLPVDGKLDVLNHLIGELGSKDLGRLSAESRLLLLQGLPEIVSYVVPKAGPREAVTTAEPASLDNAPHKLCSLEVKETELGRDVSFVIPKGMSGRRILRAIESANPRRQADGVVSPDSALLRDKELNVVAMADVSVSLSVCLGFTNLTRSEQQEQLAKHCYQFAPQSIVAVAAALYRDANGFPSERTDIGTLRDAGDLFTGLWVRTASGTMTSFPDGLRSRGWHDSAYRYDDVVAAGVPLSNVS